jgi:hypothetical protein
MVYTTYKNGDDWGMVQMVLFHPHENVVLFVSPCRTTRTSYIYISYTYTYHIHMHIHIIPNISATAPKLSLLFFSDFFSSHW